MDSLRVAHLQPISPTQANTIKQARTLSRAECQVRRAPKRALRTEEWQSSKRPPRRAGSTKCRKRLLAPEP
eukprot:11169683-Lingulodinium_polyedra.AAC.1